MFEKTYFAVVHEDGKGPWRYIVAFPDLDNIASEENTLGKVHMMASEILEGKIQDILEHKQTPPEPTEGVEELLKKVEPEFGDVAFILGVHVKVEI